MPFYIDPTLDLAAARLAYSVPAEQQAEDSPPRVLQAELTEGTVPILQ
jgi:hypothetical protein